MRKLAYKPRLTRAERRASIERAAAEAFARDGFDGASLEAIAAAAGVTKPIVYEHFASKHELYASLLGSHAKEMVRHMAGRVEGARGGPEARLRDVVDAFFAFVEERPFAWRMLFREPPSDPVLAAGAHAIHRRASDNVRRLLASVRPELRDEPGQLELRTQVLKSAQQGLAAWWYDHPEVPRSDVVDAFMAVAWRGLAR